MLIQHNMHRAPQVLAVLCLALVATSAWGQVTIATVPPNPVAGVPFVVRVTTTSCGFSLVNATVNGTNIDIGLAFACCCPLALPQSIDVTVGPLPPGTYIIRVLSTNNNNSVIGTAPTVITADIPALDPRGLAILAAALMVIAILRLR